MTPSALAPVSPQKPRPAPRLVQPWIAADVSARRITDEVMHPLISRPGAAWLASFALAVLALASLRSPTRSRRASASGV